jgi:hypothetical protein
MYLKYQNYIHGYECHAIRAFLVSLIIIRSVNKNEKMSLQYMLVILEKSNITCHCMITMKKKIKHIMFYECNDLFFGTFSHYGD